jgi:hypothetical protein
MREPDELMDYYADYLRHPELSDDDWRELLKSRDRTLAYELGWKLIALVLMLVTILTLSGLPQWLMTR